MIVLYFWKFKNNVVLNSLTFVYNTVETIYNEVQGMKENIS